MVSAMRRVPAVTRIARMSRSMAFSLQPPKRQVSTFSLILNTSLIEGAAYELKGRPLMKAFPPIHRFSLRSHHVVGCQCARRRRGGGLDLQCRVTDVEVVLELARVPACSISSLTDCLSPFPPAAARRLNCGSIARADLESNSQQCKCRALKRFRSCRTGSLHRRQWLCRW